MLFVVDNKCTAGRGIVEHGFYWCVSNVFKLIILIIKILVIIYTFLSTAIRS